MTEEEAHKKNYKPLRSHPSNPSIVTGDRNGDIKLLKTLNKFECGTKGTKLIQQFPGFYIWGNVLYIVTWGSGRSTRYGD